MIEVGMDIILELQDDLNIKKYRSKVADMHEHTLHMVYPLSIQDNRPAFLPAGTQLTISFVDKEANAYAFESQVIRAIKAEVPLVELSLPDKQMFRKVQRREYVRVKSSLNVLFEFPDYEESVTTITKDISAGGCAMILPKDTAISDFDNGEIRIKLPLEAGEKELHFSFEVVRLTPKEDQRVLSLKFIDPQPDDQKLILRYCFERQLADKRKGLLSQ